MMTMHSRFPMGSTPLWTHRTIDSDKTVAEPPCLMDSELGDLLTDQSRRGGDGCHIAE
jgi:hypothetical protein